MTTWQGRNSDWGKQAKKKTRKGWGGRYTDGLFDAKKPASWFKYKKKTLSKNGKKVYHYSTAYRKNKWKSHKKR